MFNNTYPQTEDTGFNGVPELFNTHLYQLTQGQPEFSDTVMIDASLISDALNPAVLGQNSRSQPLIWQELNRLAFLNLQQSRGYRSPDPLYTGEFLYSQNLRAGESLPLSLGTPDFNQSPNISSSFSQPSLSPSSHQSQLSVSDSCYESTADEMVESLFSRATKNLNQTGGDAGIGSCTQSSRHCQTPVSSSVYSPSSEFQPDCPNIPQAVARKSGKRKSKEPIGKSFINYPYNGKTVMHLVAQQNYTDVVSVTSRMLAIMPFSIESELKVENPLSSENSKFSLTFALLGDLNYNEKISLAKYHIPTCSLVMCSFTLLEGFA
ncbi:hypothetical protein PHYBLDRAFT_161082 [Phycomyces blakesleeanus NRRL 1555(-)]|uniref:Uncharacterized protein n=1 Tax=Phycomyces blakesleeanus (strain ATCC 8743b / DSM 1359 / FGSC 10004 / NBRC 33097 / NRRL 1555) TaxID=763407 RepID=A0A162Q645_PHYB8|nr:hypothetical protein PHYBLDRAFT_161082 [Phycomyces blakesleeanus NRRL 1555(-)]OAD80436.1 hypothetical protein PHYBLDRAFT_161082 [Phycomyces blakesleeanus NRRL 1555(-)]|eukprot:XP_018298476.1 hypothetical protein PHYBLDRAFT_161082 [Phycomyces blakesleeanus NRRL 1555(-)]